MNKKVLTLCAGFLLAGSLGVANALTLEDAVTLNEKSGDLGPKYYYLQQVDEWNGSAWAGTGYDNGYYVSNGALINGALDKLDNLASHWKVEVARKDANGIWYKLSNANDGKPLSVKYNDKEITEFLSDAIPTGDVFSLFFLEGNQRHYVFYDNNGFKLTTDIVKAVGFDLKEISEQALTAHEMNAQLKDGFKLNFTDYKTLENNPFVGKLNAVAADANGKLLTSETAKHNADLYYLTNEAGEYIVLTPEVCGNFTGSNGSEEGAYIGFQFSTISDHKWGAMTEAERKAVSLFQVRKSYDFNNTDSLIVTMPYANLKDTKGTEVLPLLNQQSETPGVRVFVHTHKDGNTEKNCVTVVEYAKANDRLADQKDYTEVGAKAPNIEFGEGTGSVIDIEKTFAGKVWNITDKDGNVLAPKFDADIDNWSQYFALGEDVDLNAPEGHWLLAKSGDYYCFVNRESGQRLVLANADYYLQGVDVVIRNTATPNLYEICYAEHQSEGNWKAVFITEAKDAELLNTEKGYVNFDMDQETLNGKYLSFESKYGKLYIGKDKDDNVVLTENQDEAIEFRVKQMTHNFSDHDGIAAPDTLHHYTTFLNKDKNGAVVSDVDTLQFFQYRLYDNFSEKYLRYNETKKKFELTKESFTGNGHENFDTENYDEYAFVIKAKEDGSYILVRDYAIDYDYCEVEGVNHNIRTDWDGNKYTFDNTFEVNFGYDAYKATRKNANGNAHKVYAGIQSEQLEDMAALYNYKDNDRITMENTDQTEYMSLAAFQDTIKVSPVGAENYFLYEQGKNGTNFLGINHIADVKDMAAAILAEASNASIENNFKPQYLLGVGAEYIPAVYDNYPHLISPDSTVGRFLVNMVDSAYAYGVDKKSNPYMIKDDNVTKYRLGFVEGVRTDNKLFLTKDGKNTGRVFDLNNNDDKVCTFAFRYTDESREAVKIETRYNTTADDNITRGWLEIHNGVPVVVNNYESGDEFVINADVTGENPTANEEISAGNVVVAGVNGAVVVKGAEGKNVIVSTILGKVVANEVVSSDNATIAAPAGVVVVSVDGESFKVVVK